MPPSQYVIGPEPPSIVFVKFLILDYYKYFTGFRANPGDPSVGGKWPKWAILGHKCAIFAKF